MIMPATPRHSRSATALLTGCLLAGCGASPRVASLPQPPTTIGDWRSQPPLGYDARADRRNLRPGESFRFGQLEITVVAATIDSAASDTDPVELQFAEGGTSERRLAAEGSAFNWRGYHVAVVAVGNPGELGAGLVSLEVGELESLPRVIAESRVAGGASLRLRVPHEIRYITLHHTGDAQPLRPEDDPVAKLRGLQSWGASDRNWWDVPYHLLLDLQGRVYAGRDWHYMGETNTTYDPRGHLLISVIGNYERQQPTPEQLASIVDLMAWAVVRFGIPLERIGGHYNYASTGCPGKYLRQYLEDGTFRRLVAERLAKGDGGVQR